MPRSSWRQALSALLVAWGGVAVDAAVQRLTFDDAGAAWVGAGDSAARGSGRAVPASGEFEHHVERGVRPGQGAGYVSLSGGAHIELGDAGSWPSQTDMTVMAWIRPHVATLENAVDRTLFSMGSPRTAERCAEWTPHAYGILSGFPEHLINTFTTSSGIESCKSACSADAACRTIEYSAVTSACALYNCTAGAAGCEPAVPTAPAAPLAVTSSCIDLNPGMQFVIRSLYPVNAAGWKSQYNLVFKWNGAECSTLFVYDLAVYDATRWRLVSFTVSAVTGTVRIEAHDDRDTGAASPWAIDGYVPLKPMIETQCVNSAWKKDGFGFTSGHTAAFGADMNGVTVGYRGDVDDVTVASYGTSAAGVAATRRLAADLSLLFELGFDDGEAGLRRDGAPRNDVAIQPGMGVKGAALAVNLNVTTPDDAAFAVALPHAALLGKLPAMSVCAWIKPMCWGAASPACGLPWAVRAPQDHSRKLTLSLTSTRTMEHSFDPAASLSTYPVTYKGCMKYNIADVLASTGGPHYTTAGYYIRTTAVFWRATGVNIHSCSTACLSRPYFLLADIGGTTTCVCSHIDPAATFAREADDSLCGSVCTGGDAAEPGGGRCGSGDYAVAYEHITSTQPYVLAAPGAGGDPNVPPYCPAGTLPVSSKIQCEVAAQTLGFNQAAQSYTAGEEPQHPDGCVLKTSGGTIGTLYWNPDGRPDALSQTTEKKVCYVPDANLTWTTDRWQWVCATKRAGGTHKLYVDNDLAWEAQESAADAAFEFLAGDLFEIGGGGRTPQTQFRGLIDGVRVSRREEAPAVEGFQHWRLQDVNRVYHTGLLGALHTGLVTEIPADSPTNHSTATAFAAAKVDAEDAHLAYRVRVQKAGRLDLELLVAPEEVNGVDAFNGTARGIAAKIQQSDAPEWAKVRFESRFNDASGAYPGSCPAVSLSASSSHEGHGIEQVRYEDDVAWAAAGGAAEAWVLWNFTDAAPRPTGLRVTAKGSLRDLFIRATLEHSRDGATWHFLSNIVPDTDSTAQQRFGGWRGAPAAPLWRLRMTPDTNGNLGVDYLALDLDGYPAPCGGVADCEYVETDQADLASSCPPEGRGQLLDSFLQSTLDSDVGAHVCEAACNDAPLCNGYAFYEEDPANVNASTDLNCSLITDLCAFGNAGEPVTDNNWTLYDKTTPQCGWLDVRYPAADGVPTDLSVHYNALSKQVQFSQTAASAPDGGPAVETLMGPFINQHVCDDEDAPAHADPHTPNSITSGFFLMSDCVAFCEASDECMLCMPSACALDSGTQVCTYTALRQCRNFAAAPGSWVSTAPLGGWGTSWGFAKKRALLTPLPGRAMMSACDAACDSTCDLSGDPLAEGCVGSSTGGARSFDLERMFRLDTLVVGAAGTLTPWDDGVAAASLTAADQHPDLTPVSGGVAGDAGTTYTARWLAEMDVAVYPTAPVPTAAADFRHGYVTDSRGSVIAGNFELAGAAGLCGADVGVCLVPAVPMASGFAHLTSPLPTNATMTVHARFGVEPLGEYSLPHHYGVAVHSGAPGGALQALRGLVFVFDGVRGAVGEEGVLRVLRKSPAAQDGAAVVVANHSFAGTAVSLADAHAFDAWVTVEASGSYAVAVAAAAAGEALPEAVPDQPAFMFSGTYANGTLDAEVGAAGRAYVTAYAASGCGEKVLVFHVGYEEGNTTGASVNAIDLQISSVAGWGDVPLTVRVHPGHGNVSLQINGTYELQEEALGFTLPLATSTVRVILRTNGTHSFELEAGNSLSIDRFSHTFANTFTYVGHSAASPTIDYATMALDDGYISDADGNWTSGTYAAVTGQASVVEVADMGANPSLVGQDRQATNAVHQVRFETHCRASRHTLERLSAVAVEPEDTVATAQQGKAMRLTGDTATRVSAPFDGAFPSVGFAVDLWVRRDADLPKAALLSYVVPGDHGARFELSDTGGNMTVRMGSHATYEESVDVPDSFNPLGAPAAILHGYACANAEQPNNTVPEGDGYFTSAECEAFCRNSHECTACTPRLCALTSGVCSCRYRAVRQCVGAAALPGGCTAHPTTRKPADWVHVAFKYSAPDGCWAFYRNGEQQEAGCELLPEVHVPPGGRLVLGQRALSSNTADAQYALRGSLADLRLWRGVPNAACLAPGPASTACTGAEDFGIAGRWPLQNGSLEDDSGHGRHFTVDALQSGGVDWTQDAPSTTEFVAGSVQEAGASSSAGSSASAGPPVEEHPDFTHANPAQCLQVISADLSGDGRLDVVCVEAEGSGRIVYFSPEAWGAKVVLGTNLAAVCEASLWRSFLLRAGDADGDGDIDVYGICEGKILMWLNDGLGASFVARDTRLPPEVSSEVLDGICIGDIEGDGAAEAIVSYQDPTLSPPQPNRQAPYSDWRRDDLFERYLNGTKGANGTDHDTECVPWMKGNDFGEPVYFDNGTLSHTEVRNLTWRVSFQADEYSRDQSIFTYSPHRLRPWFWPGTIRKFYDYGRIGPDDLFSLRFEDGKLVCHSPAGFVKYTPADRGGAWAAGATYTAMCVWDGDIAGMWMYVDGLLVGYVQGEGIENGLLIHGTKDRPDEDQVIEANDQPFLIGCSEGWERWDDFFRGFVRNLDVWGRVLHPDEVLPTAHHTGSLDVALSIDFDDAFHIARDASWYKWNVSDHYAVRDLDGVSGSAVKLSPHGPACTVTEPVKSLLPDVAEVTLAAWVKVAAGSGENHGVLFGAADASAFAFGIRLYPNGKVACSFPGVDSSGSPTVVMVVSEGAVAAGTWAHVTCTFSARPGVASVFIDFVNEGSVTHGSVRLDLPDNTLKVGPDWSGEGASVDGVRVFLGAVEPKRLVDAFGTSARLAYRHDQEVNGGTAQLIPSTRFSSSNQKTVAFFVNVDTSFGLPTWDASTERCLVALGSGTVADGDRVKICFTATKVKVGSDTTFGEFALPRPMGAGWMHVAVRQRADSDRGLYLYSLADTRLALFIDGEFVEEKTIPGGFAPAWQHGDNEGSYGGGWYGSVQDFRLYTGEISRDEIRNIATRGAFDIISGIVWGGGHPEFTTSSRSAVPHITRASGRVVGCEDYDADGDIDVALASQAGTAPGVTLYENTGSGVFAPARLDPATAESRAFGWKPRPSGEDEVDVTAASLTVNADDVREVLEARSDGTIVLYGTSHAWFTGPVREQLCDALAVDITDPAPVACRLRTAFPASSQAEPNPLPAFYALLDTFGTEYLVKFFLHGLGEALETNPMQVVSFAVGSDIVTLPKPDGEQAAPPAALRAPGMQVANSGGGVAYASAVGVYVYGDPAHRPETYGRAPSSHAEDIHPVHVALASYELAEGEGAYVFDRRVSASGRLTGDAMWVAADDDAAFPTSVGVQGSGAVRMNPTAPGASSVTSLTAGLWVRQRCASAATGPAVVVSVAGVWELVLRENVLMVQGADGAMPCGAARMPMGCGDDWHHAAVTWDAAEGFRIYVDGRSVMTCGIDFFEGAIPAAVDFAARGDGTEVVLGAGLHGAVAGFILSTGAWTPAEVKALASRATLGPVPKFFPGAAGIDCPASGGWVAVPEDITAAEGRGPTCVQIHEPMLQHRDALGHCARRGRCDYGALGGAGVSDDQTLTTFRAETSLTHCQDVCCGYPGCEGVQYLAAARTCTLLRGFSGFTPAAPNAATTTLWQVVRQNPAHHFRLEGVPVVDEMTNTTLTASATISGAGGRHGLCLELGGDTIAGTLSPATVHTNVWTLGMWIQRPFTGAFTGGFTRCHVMLGDLFEFCTDNNGARVVSNAVPGATGVDATRVSIYTDLPDDMAWHYYEVSYNGYSLHYSRDCDGAEQMVVDGEVLGPLSEAASMITEIHIGRGFDEVTTRGGNYRYDELKLFPHFAPTCGAAGALARTAPRRGGGAFLTLRSAKEASWIEQLLDPTDAVWLGVTSGSEAYTDYPGRVACYKSPSEHHPILRPRSGEWDCADGRATARAVCEQPGTPAVPHSAPVLYTTLEQDLFPANRSAEPAGKDSGDPYWRTVLAQEGQAVFPAGRYEAHGVPGDAVFVDFDQDWASLRDEKGQLEFKLSYPDGDCHGHAVHDMVWQQATLPHGHGDVEQFTPVAIPHPTRRGLAFQGLLWSRSSTALLSSHVRDGEAVFAVGARVAAGCGVAGPQGIPVSKVKLSVRVPRPPAPRPASAATVSFYVKAAVAPSRPKWKQAARDCPGPTCGCDGAASVRGFVGRHLAEETMRSMGAHSITVSANSDASPGTAWACGVNSDGSSRGEGDTEQSNFHTLSGGTRQYGVFSYMAAESDRPMLGLVCEGDSAWHGRCGVSLGAPTTSTVDPAEYVQQAQLLPNRWAGNTWQHFLATWESETGCWQVFHNGDVVARGCGHNVGGVVAPNGTLTFGQRVTGVSAGARPICDAADALHGSVADFHMWDRVLSAEEIHSMYHTGRVYYDLDPAVRTPPVAVFPLRQPDVTEGASGAGPNATVLHLLQTDGVFDFSSEEPKPPGPPAEHRDDDVTLFVRRFTGEDVEGYIGVSDAALGFASQGATVCGWHRSLDTERTLFAYSPAAKHTGEAAEPWTSDFAVACARGVCWVELGGSGRIESPSFVDTLVSGEWRHFCVAVTAKGVEVVVQGKEVKVTDGRARVTAATALVNPANAFLVARDSRSDAHTPATAVADAARCYQSSSSDTLTLTLSHPFVVVAVVITGLDILVSDVSVHVDDSPCALHLRLEGRGPHAVVCDAPLTGERVTISSPAGLHVCDVSVKVARGAAAWADVGVFRLGAHPRAAFDQELLFAGALADVRVWGAARTKKELMRDVVSRDAAGAGLWAAWKMAESRDASGNGRDLETLGGAGVLGLHGRWVKVLQHRAPQAWGHMNGFEQAALARDAEPVKVAALGRLAEDYRLPDGSFALQAVYPGRAEGRDRLVWFQESDLTLAASDAIDGYIETSVTDNNAELADFAGLGLGGGYALLEAAIAVDPSAQLHQYVLGMHESADSLPARATGADDGYSAREVQLYAFTASTDVCTDTWERSRVGDTSCKENFVEHLVASRGECERRCRSVHGCVEFTYPHTCDTSRFPGAGDECCRVHAPGVLTTEVDMSFAGASFTLATLQEGTSVLPGASVTTLPEELLGARAVEAQASTSAGTLTVTVPQASWLYVIYDSNNDGGFAALSGDGPWEALPTQRAFLTSSSLTLSVLRRLIPSGVTNVPASTGAFTFAVKAVAEEGGQTGCSPSLGAGDTGTLYHRTRTCRAPRDPLPQYEPVGEPLRGQDAQCHPGSDRLADGMTGSSVLGGDTTAADCAAVCRATAGCWYFTYYHDTGACALRASCPLLHYSTGGLGHTYKLTLPASQDPVDLPFSVPPPPRRVETPPNAAPSYQSNPGQATYYPHAVIPPGTHPVNAFTIEFWMKPYAASCATCSQAPVSLTAAGEVDAFALEIGNGMVQKVVVAGEALATPAPGVAFEDGKWHHVAFAWDSVTREGVFRVDGVSHPAINTDPNRVPPTRSVLRVGQYFPEGVPRPSKAFDGEVVHIRLWNGVRTGEEIDTCRHGRVGAFQAPLVGAWSLEDDLRDTSGRALHLVHQTSSIFEPTGLQWITTADEVQQTAATTEVECSALCAAEPTCTAWEWTTSPDMCTTTTSEELVWEPGAGVSGRFKGCTGVAWEDVDGVLAGPLTSTPWPEVTNIAEGYWFDEYVTRATACAAACASRPACRGWTWKSADSMCYNFANVSAATIQPAAAGVVSGVLKGCRAFQSVTLVPVVGDKVESVSHLRGMCAAAGLRPLDIATAEELAWTEEQLRLGAAELTNPGVKIPLAHYYSASGNGLGNIFNLLWSDATRVNDLFIGMPGLHGHGWAMAADTLTDADGMQPGYFVGVDLGAKRQLSSWAVDDTNAGGYIACASTDAKVAYHDLNVADSHHPMCTGTQAICECDNGACATPFGPCVCHDQYYPPGNCSQYCPHVLQGGTDCVIDAVPNLAQASDPSNSTTPAPAVPYTTFDLATMTNQVPVWQTTSVHLPHAHPTYEVKIVRAGGRACASPPAKANTGGGFASVAPSPSADDCAAMVDARYPGADVAYLWHEASQMCYKSDTVVAAMNSEYVGCLLSAAASNDVRCASLSPATAALGGTSARRGDTEVVHHVTVTVPGEYLVCYSAPELNGGAWASTGGLTVREWTCEEKQGLVPETQCTPGE